MHMRMDDAKGMHAIENIEFTIYYITGSRKLKPIYVHGKICDKYSKNMDCSPEKKHFVAENLA